MDFSQYIDKAILLVLEYTPKLALALVVLIVGLGVIGLLIKILEKALSRLKMDETLTHFLSSLASWTLKILLFISVASMVGIATTSFVAILGAAGLAIGLALQGSLSNFASGVLLLVFKPYKVGDLIESQGELGTVQQIQIFNTILRTFQNKTIILPNSTVTSHTITNVTENGTLRVDMEVGISYKSSIEEAKKIILETINKNPHILQDPAPKVGVSALADSSVNLQVMPWTKAENYWEVYFGLREEIKLALDNNGVSIPFPQRDVHIYNH